MSSILVQLHNIEHFLPIITRNIFTEPFTFTDKTLQSLIAKSSENVYKQRTRGVVDTYILLSFSNRRRIIIIIYRIVYVCPRALLKVNDLSKEKRRRRRRDGVYNGTYWRYLLLHALHILPESPGTEKKKNKFQKSCFVRGEYVKRKTALSRCSDITREV